jgi:hypothetical protein
MTPHDAALLFARIGMDVSQNLGLGSNSNLSYPWDSLRYSSIFAALPANRAAGIILLLCRLILNGGKDALLKNRPLAKDGSEYNPKDHHIKDGLFSYAEIIQMLLGSLVYLIARERTADTAGFIFPEELKAALESLIEDILESADVKKSNPEYGIARFLRRSQEIFTADITHIDHGFKPRHEDWVAQLGLEEAPFVF